MTTFACFNRSVCSLLVAALSLLYAHTTTAAEPFVQLDSPSTPAGYLASLLINESPFPGERGFVSETDTRAAMTQILFVLNSRIYHIPDGYTQARIADIQSTNIIDVITAGGEKGQCDGFYKNANGKPVSAARVQARIDNLLSIANRGDKPGRFTSLLAFARDLSRAYTTGGMTGADRFAGITRVGKRDVTGRAYSWMTDKDYYKPGGSFIAITDSHGGSLGGNRFFTLKKESK